MFFITVINLILTYSRGYYIVFILGITVLIYESKKISKKIKFSLFFISGLLFLIFIYLFPSVFLKQSNRTFLSGLAIKNIEVVDGTGGGFYIKEVYREHHQTLLQHQQRLVRRNHDRCALPSIVSDLLCGMCC